MDKSVYGVPGAEFLRMIDSMLPDRLFDAHMHVSHIALDSDNTSGDALDLAAYQASLAPMVLGRRLCCNAIPFPCAALKDPAVRDASTSFLEKQLGLSKDNVGELMVMPTDTEKDIEARLLHPQIRGLKCYWVYSESGLRDQSDIGDYLPEAAWKVADKKGLYITLHMVKDKALSDPHNLSYIKLMAKKYPNAVLILAHCARAFAAWTVFDVVDELVNLENVYFDFSGIAESPAMSYIVKMVGIKRCMWGTDFPICSFIGKPVSIADTFSWITGEELSSINKDGAIRPWFVGAEGLMAFWQTVKLLDLTARDIEDYFYNTAASLFYQNKKTC